MKWADIETVLLGEWAVFGPALVLAVGLAAAAAAIWMLFSWRYTGLVTSLRVRLKQAEDRYRAFDREFPGKAPADVADRVRRLERQIAALPPRRLTDAQKQAIAEAGPPPATASRVAIVHDAASPEVGRYAHDFIEAFSAAPGWNVVKELYPMPPSRSPIGVSVGLGDPANPSAVEVQVQQALRNAEVEYDCLPRITPGADVEIIVSGR